MSTTRQVGLQRFLTFDATDKIGYSIVQIESIARTPSLGVFGFSRTL